MHWLGSSQREFLGYLLCRFNIEWIIINLDSWRLWSLVVVSFLSILRLVGLSLSQYLIQLSYFLTYAPLHLLWRERFDILRQILMALFRSELLIDVDAVSVL
jgi:hypothetical protein